MSIFTIWEGDRCGCALWLGEGPPTYANGALQDPDAAKVATFSADSWEDACQKYNDHYGFGEYIPPEGGWAPIEDATSPQDIG